MEFACIVESEGFAVSLSSVVEIENTSPKVSTAAKVVGVIPARFASTRFPGKPLTPIAGRPMIVRVIEQVQKAQGFDQLLVATYHPEIASVSERAGAHSVMTPSDLPSGSDRVYFAVKNLNCDYVVNIQGDEPLLNPLWLETLVECLKSNPQADMATLAREATRADLTSPTTAKIVVDQNLRALYFSRFAIPFSRGLPAPDNAGQNVRGCLKHIGVYGYKKSFLAQFCAQQPVEIETLEALEQLRALYLGAHIQVARVAGDSWGVDVPEDVAKVERLLNAD